MVFIRATSRFEDEHGSSASWTANRREPIGWRCREFIRIWTNPAVAQCPETKLCKPAVVQCHKTSQTRDHTGSPKSGYPRSLCVLKLRKPLFEQRSMNDIFRRKVISLNLKRLWHQILPPSSCPSKVVRKSRQINCLTFGNDGYTSINGGCHNVIPLDMAPNYFILPPRAALTRRSYCESHDKSTASLAKTIATNSLWAVVATIWYSWMWGDHGTKLFHPSSFRNPISLGLERLGAHGIKFLELCSLSESVLRKVSNKISIRGGCLNVLFLDLKSSWQQITFIFPLQASPRSWTTFNLWWLPQRDISGFEDFLAPNSFICPVRASPHFWPTSYQRLLPLCEISGSTGQSLPPFRLSH